jgi:chromosome segregation ATPase
MSPEPPSYEDLQKRLDAVTSQLQEATAAQAAAEATVKVLSETAQAQTSELSQLRTTLDQREAQHQEEIANLRAEAETRLTEAVKSALEQQAKEQERTVEELRADRDRLQETVKSLQDQLGAVAEERVTQPTSLAESFAQVIEQLAQRPPAAGQDVEVNLSRLEVEARGVVRAAADEGDPPEFVTLAPGQIDSGQLSTMRMEFRLSPRIPRATDEG